MELIENLRESRLKSYSSTPGDIEEHRRAEYRVAADTAGRPLIELLQNADDALQLILNPIRRAVKIILNQQRLLISNDGEPFSPEGVEAICNLDRSPKKDRRITIGNKGIGFKSVLLWATAPSIFSSTFQFTFDREKSAEAISKTIGNQLGRDYSSQEVPLMRLPFSTAAYDTQIEHMNKEGFSTTIVLPLRSEEVYRDIENELEEMDGLSLIFLHAISTLEIITPELKRNFKICRAYENTQILKDESCESYRHISREIEIPSEIRKGLPEDYQDLTHCRISIAIPETPLKENPKLFVYFPTSERFPFLLLINGDFILDTGRKHLSGVAERYHQWMASNIADLFCDKALPFLIEKYDSATLDFLFCRNVEDMENYERVIFDAFKERLLKENFLPAMGNQKKKVSPDKACLLSEEMAEDVTNICEGEVECKGRLMVDPKWCSGQRIETLERLGARKLLKKDLIEVIGSKARTEPSWCSNALNILLKWAEKAPRWSNRGEETQDSLLDAITKQRLFLTDNQNLRSLADEDEELAPLFLFPPGSVLKPPPFININFFHPDITKDFSKEDRKVFEKNLDLLSNRGLNKFRPSEVVEMAVLPIISMPKIEELSCEDRVLLLRFLAELGINEKKFEDTEPYPWFDDMRSKLAKFVYVPNRDGDLYPAWKVYAGNDWGAVESLEHLYKGQADRKFLARPDDAIHQGITIENWKRLYRYIGVSWEPKILPVEVEPDHITFYHFLNPHPSQLSESEWKLYHEYLQNDQELSDMWKWGSINLKESYVLDGWKDMRHETQKFLESAYKTDLFKYLVGENKSKISIRFKYTKISCNYYENCASFLSWAMRYLSWLKSDDGVAYLPQEVFLKNSEIGQGLGALIPLIDLSAPTDKTLFRRWEDLLDEIGIRRKWEQINLEDWQKWLENVPEKFPNPGEEAANAIKELYLECLKRCPTESNDEAPFSHLKVPVLKSEGIYYYEEAGRVIYFDDSRFDNTKPKLYEQGLGLFPIELGGKEKQQRAKLLFGMTLVSEKVRETVTPDNENNHKTEEWNQKFERIKPVLLARLSKERPESRDKDKGLLLSIELQAFDGLRRQFHIIGSGVFLVEESATACWSDDGGENRLLINVKEAEKRLWSSIADALAQRFGRTYYEAFKLLLLCTSDGEIVDELRHAGVSEDDIRSCKEALKGTPTLHIPAEETKGSDETIKEEAREEIKVATSMEIKEPRLIMPGEGIFGIPSEIKPGTYADGEGAILITGRASFDKTVRPGPDPFTKEDIEKAAMKWAMTYETENGRDPKDVSLYNLGYDIESRNLVTGEVERHIEVKGASGKPEKREITVNEWREAIKKSDRYYIYYVLGLGTDEGEIRIVKNPASKLNPEEKTFNISIPRDLSDEVLSIKKKKSE